MKKLGKNVLKKYVPPAMWKPTNIVRSVKTERDSIENNQKTESKDEVKTQRSETAFDHSRGLDKRTREEGIQQTIEGAVSLANQNISMALDVKDVGEGLAKTLLPGPYRRSKAQAKKILDKMLKNTGKKGKSGLPLDKMRVA